jgi:hypothetical protein
MLAPVLHAIWFYPGRAVIAMCSAMFISPSGLLYQATWWHFSGHLIQGLMGWVAVNQTVQAIWLTGPNMQFIILLIYGWVLSQLICR